MAVQKKASTGHRIPKNLATITLIITSVIVQTFTFFKGYKIFITIKGITDVIFWKT